MFENSPPDADEGVCQICLMRARLMERWDRGVEYQGKLITIACPLCYVKYLWNKTTG